MGIPLRSFIRWRSGIPSSDTITMRPGVHFMCRWKDAFLAGLALGAVMLGVLTGQSRLAQREKSPVKERRFLFTYAGTLKDLSPGKTASIWLPLAGSGPMQDVAIHAKKLPAEGKIHKEKQYG